MSSPAWMRIGAAWAAAAQVISAAVAHASRNAIFAISVTPSPKPEKG
jgi:hypothetical protein